MPLTPWEGAKYPPRRWQAEALEAVRESLGRGETGVVSAVTGCHARGQRLLMFDGATKAVEDVEVGDLLMGPDSTPRRVLRLHRGFGRMYDVIPVKGEPWTASEGHVFSVVDTRSNCSGSPMFAPYIDRTTEQLLAMPPSTRAFQKQVRVGVDFPKGEPLPLPAYILGVLLGDGSLKRRVAVTTADPEVAREVEAYADSVGHSLRRQHKPGNQAETLYITLERGSLNSGSQHYRSRFTYDQAEDIRARVAAGETRTAIAADLDVSMATISDITRGKTYTKPPPSFSLLRAVENLGLCGTGSADKFIPRAYRVASRVERLELLAGLLDTDGCLSRGGYDYISKSPELALDVAFVARSLGLAAYVTSCEKACQTGARGIYFRVSISGDCSVVPVRIPRKRAPPRRQRKSVLRTGFDLRLRPKPEPHFGVQVDGDCRYLLDDFTVTHNSGKSCLIAELAYLATVREKVTVIATPTQQLVEQLAKTVAERVGDCGRFYGRAKEIRSVIVVCYPSVGTLAVELAARGLKVGLLICDELHRTEADNAIESLPLLDARWRVGLTATAYRSDEKESLSIWTSMIYKYTYADALRDGVLVPFRVLNYDGTGSDDVDDVVHRMLGVVDGPGIISARHIEDAEEYAAYLQRRGVAVEAIHSKLPSKAQTARIAALEAGDLQALVHVAMLTEGVDFPWLRWLGFRRPVGARVRLVQELGRGLRSHPGKTECIVLDPHDLLGTLGIAHPEALGLALEQPEADVRRVILNPVQQEAAEMPPAVAVDELTRWARGLSLALQAEGLVVGKAIRAVDWRTEPPSRKQLDALGRMKWAVRYLPAEHRDAVKAAIDSRWALQRGAASDLLDVLLAMAEATKEGRGRARRTGNWRRKIVGWPAGLDVPPLGEAVTMRLGMEAG